MRCNWPYIAQSYLPRQRMVYLCIQVYQAVRRQRKTYRNQSDPNIFTVVSFFTISILVCPISLWAIADLPVYKMLFFVASLLLIILFFLTAIFNAGLLEFLKSVKLLSLRWSLHLLMPCLPYHSDMELELYSELTFNYYKMALSRSNLNDFKYNFNYILWISEPSCNILLLYIMQ